MNMLNPEERSYPPTTKPQQQGLAEMFGINAAIKVLRRRLLLIIGVGVIAAGLTFGNAMLAKPKYSASALVMINSRQERVLDGNETVLGQLPRDSAVIDSEIEILRSPALMSRLVDALNLTADPEFNWTLRTEEPSFFDQLFKHADRTQAPEEPAPDPTAQTEVDPALREAIVSSLQYRIGVRRRGLTYVIEISGTSGNPERAQQLANTYADIYLASQSEARAESTRRVGDWLTQRLEQLRQDVQDKETAAEEFRARTGIVSASGTPLSETQIANIQNQVLAAQADLAEREARLRQLQQLRDNGGSIETIGDALNSTAILNLRSREAEIARRQTELETRYFPTHPDVIAVRSEREDIQRQIREEIQRISTNLQNEVDVARSRLATLQASMNSASSQLVGNNSDAVRLRELEREAAASRRVYETFLQRQQEITDLERINTTDVRLVSYAREPSVPSSPNSRVALVLAVMVGLFLGVLAGVIAEMFDRSIHGPDDIESKVGYPAVTSVPTISKRALRTMPPTSANPPGYLVERPMSGFTETLRVLRTVIVHSRIDAPTRVVAVASALPGEGKTTISMSLARVAAMSGQRVLVIDCDLRKRSINEILDIEPEVGLLQVLAGEISWRQAIRRDELTHADILPVATSNFTPLDIFGSDAMKGLLNELRKEYELIVLDCAPLLAVAETRVVTTLADGVVIIAQVGKSSADAVRTAIEHAVTAGAQVIGVVLNKVPVEGFGRFAYSDSRYYYESKSYYSTP